MKNILIALLLFPLATFSQKKGYAFVGAGAFVVLKSVKPTGKLALGFNPVKNAGIGGEFSYTHDFGLSAMGDFRFISDPTKAGTLFGSLKIGSNFYRKNNLTGGLAYGVEIGLAGNKKETLFISVQYNGINYNQKIVNSSFKLKYDLFGFLVGAKF